MTPPDPSWRPCYLRFGDLPPGNRSFGAGATVSGLFGTAPVGFERGVSVFKGYETPEGNYLIDFEGNEAALSFGYLTYNRDTGQCWGGGRPLYEVEGREMDTRGQSGEPLLTDITRCEPIPAGAALGTTTPIPAGIAALHRGVGFAFEAWSLLEMGSWCLEGKLRQLKRDRALGRAKKKEETPEAPAPGQSEGPGRALRLVETVMSRATPEALRLRRHGPEHWKKVAITGAELAEEVPGVDLVVVFLFALFHDAARFDDGGDPGHGERAALLVGQARKDLGTDPQQWQMLKDACALHEEGGLSADPTVAVCWDADRLN
ncbi:MAG: HD domain-containing protein, partial [Actinomycetota bacterium]|nr:HD domain-containing protein [Actinomycetota bacterium]